MRWDSPWGEGFPGWHLECSAMSTKYLGETFDIHGGGMDLKFPHHECEIAQNVAASGCEHSVNYWIHANMLTLNGTKMSKSLGNSILPREFFSGDHELLNRAFSPMTLRFSMMQSHYRSTLDLSNEALEAAEKGLQRIWDAYEKIDDLSPASENSQDIADFFKRAHTAMDDDFSTAQTIAVIFEAVKYINNCASGNESINEEGKSEIKRLIDLFIIEIMGVAPETVAANDDEEVADGLMDLILDLRQKARGSKDFATADQIRDELSALGITIKDSRDGATWEKS